MLLLADAEYLVAPRLADHDTTAWLLAQSITTETPVGMHGADRRKDHVRTSSSKDPHSTILHSKFQNRIRRGGGGEHGHLTGGWRPRWRWSCTGSWRRRQTLSRSAHMPNRERCIGRRETCRYTMGCCLSSWWRCSCPPHWCPARLPWRCWTRSPGRRRH